MKTKFSGSIDFKILIDLFKQLFIGPLHLFLFVFNIKQRKYDLGDVAKLLTFLL